jgi:hypothetical protein
MQKKLIDSPRDDFLLVAERELLVFERRERELGRQERLERAMLKFPDLVKEPHQSNKTEIRARQPKLVTKRHRQITPVG